MKKIEKIIIVGQGISGSMLYYFLKKAGIECFVIDNNKQYTASRVAAGLINPVTGRRIVKTWLIDEVLPAIKLTYENIGKEYGIDCLYEKGLTWFFPAPDILLAFEKRIEQKTDYLSECLNNESQQLFSFPYKAGCVSPCYIADVALLLPAMRKRMKEQDQLLEEKFDHAALEVNLDQVKYRSLVADMIIFAEGYGAVNNPYFNKLPYTINKGEALILEIKDLPANKIYKGKNTLIPLAKENLWWYGSNYIWEFEDELPTEAFRKQSEEELRNWLKLPFRILDHLAAVRYGTVERRPFVGLHPEHKRVGIFNGWGTKGCSLAPYFAEQFVRSLESKDKLLQEVDINRFKNLLSNNGQ